MTTKREMREKMPDAMEVVDAFASYGLPVLKAYERGYSVEWPR